MTKLGAWKMASTVLVLCAATAAAWTQTFTTLAEFDGTNGYGPYYMSLIQGTDGNYYGTTAFGGVYENGNIFRITPDGLVTLVYSFCEQTGCTDGNTPSAALVLARDGNFYGTTYTGGGSNGGVVFRVQPNGIYTALYDCSGGCTGQPEAPQSPLIQGTDGNLYGTSLLGGHRGACKDRSGCGSLFGITTQGSLTGVYGLCNKSNCADGDFPIGGLVQGTDGNFYGTTTQGGSSDYGTVFRITRKGNLTTLYSFCSQPGCSDGAIPDAGLIQGLDGDFYGTTTQGGSANPTCPGVGCGTIFKITSSGVLTGLYQFCSQPNCSDGYEPQAGVIQATDGNLYGTTLFGGSDLTDCDGQAGGLGCGTVFQLTLDGVLTTVHSFSNSDGAYVRGGLLQATNGLLYGATTGGGNASCPYQAAGCGTVFSVSNGLGPFVAFVRGAAKVAQNFGLLGQGFTGTTGVSLNGAPATFAVKSDTLIEATVPAGATTGYVTVTTPTGTLTSNVPFHVIP